VQDKRVGETAVYSVAVWNVNIRGRKEAKEGKGNYLSVDEIQ
jgi:hypothetical protein